MCVSDHSLSLSVSYSQQPIPERLRIRVNRISMHAYEDLHYHKDKLKEACKCKHAHFLQFTTFFAHAHSPTLSIRGMVCDLKLDHHLADII